MFHQLQTVVLSSPLTVAEEAVGTQRLFPQAQVVAAVLVEHRACRQGLMGTAEENPTHLVVL